MIHSEPQYSISQPPMAPHDYSLEPLDETIAELQSSVVQSRLRADGNRHQLIQDLVAAVESLVTTGDVRQAMTIAANALRLREECFK